MQAEGAEDKSSFARSGYGVTGIKHQEEHGGESGEDGHVSEVGIPISPLTGRRSRSKQGTVFSVQAENISRMFGDGAREQTAMAASNRIAAAITKKRRAIARTMGLRDNRTGGRAAVTGGESRGRNVGKWKGKKVGRRQSAARRKGKQISHNRVC